MGFNTTVLILNDGLTDIEKHPEQFVKGILHNMREGGDIPVGNHCNPAHVMRTEHADVFRLYATYRNSIVELSKYNKDTMKMINGGHDFQKRFVEDLIERAEDYLEDLRKCLTSP